jgi:hypothetical protein
MSNNKFKYFAVTTTTVVKAKNKADAEKIAMSTKRTANLNQIGELLFKDVEVERITALQAHEQTAV